MLSASLVDTVSRSPIRRSVRTPRGCRIFAVISRRSRCASSAMAFMSSRAPLRYDVVSRTKTPASTPTQSTSAPASPVATARSTITPIRIGTAASQTWCRPISAVPVHNRRPLRVMVRSRIRTPACT